MGSLITDSFNKIVDGSTKMVGFGNYYPDDDHNENFECYIPEISDIDSVVDLILMKANIAVLLGKYTSIYILISINNTIGPDISRECGLPTIGGDNGYITLKSRSNCRRKWFDII